MYALPEARCLTNDERLMGEFGRLFKEQKKKKKEQEEQKQEGVGLASKENDAEQRITQKAEVLLERLGELERRADRVLERELMPLLLKARALAFKRVPETRDKIVSLNLAEIIAGEEKALADYLSFASRSDFERIKERWPEVVDYVSEPLVLLEMAWSKLKPGSEEETSVRRKMTPSEFRDKQFERMMVTASDEAMSEVGAIKAEVIRLMEKAKAVNEMSGVIDASDGLTEEQKKEIKEFLGNGRERKESGLVELI